MLFLNHYCADCMYLYIVTAWKFLVSKIYMNSHLYAKKCICPILSFFEIHPTYIPWPSSLLGVSYPADFSAGRVILGYVGSGWCWKLGTSAGLSSKGLFSWAFRRTHPCSADQSFLASVSVQQVAIPSSVKSKSNFYHLIGILMETNSRTG